MTPEAWAAELARRDLTRRLQEQIDRYRVLADEARRAREAQAE